VNLYSGPERKLLGHSTGRSNVGQHYVLGRIHKTARPMQPHRPCQDTSPVKVLVQLFMLTLTAEDAHPLAQQSETFRSSGR
jgi:hypothetical protein